MAENTANATNDEFRVALSGLMIQAEAHGLDMTDESVRAFVVHTAEVMAQNAANERATNNMVHLR